MTASPRVLVAGVGNLFLGDDGFGPEVARRLTQAQPSDSLPAGVRVVDYGIRGLHLAYDLLAGYDALVLVDLVPARGEPGRITALEVTAQDLGGGQVDAHGMDPVAMLASLDGLGGRLPRTVVVGCEPASVAEGIGLSAPVEAAVEQAIATVRTIAETLVTGAELVEAGGGNR